MGNTEDHWPGPGLSCGVNMEAAGVGRDFKTVRMTHNIPTLEVLDPAANQNSLECLLIADFQGRTQKFKFWI